MKKISSKNSDKGKLAEGAEEIRKAQKEAREEKAELGSLVIPDSTRPIEDIVRDRVIVLDGHIGLKLAEDTPIEESLRVLDWATQMSDHVGFMIGDVLNFCQAKWGEKYTAALNQTGRAKSTLKHYANVAARIPAAKRSAVLSFSHYVEIARLEDRSDVGTITEDIVNEIKGGNQVSVRDVRQKVAKMLPKKPQKATSGKGKRKTRPEPPPYEPDAEEQAKLDSAEEKFNAAANAVKSTKLQLLVAKLDNTEKQRWLAMLEPLATFYNNLERNTGYY